MVRSLRPRAITLNKQAVGRSQFDAPDNRVVLFQFNGMTEETMAVRSANWLGEAGSATGAGRRGEAIGPRSRSRSCLRDRPEMERDADDLLGRGRRRRGCTAGTEAIPGGGGPSAGREPMMGREIGYDAQGSGPHDDQRLHQGGGQAGNPPHRTGQSPRADETRRVKRKMTLRQAAVIQLQAVGKNWARPHLP